MSEIITEIFDKVLLECPNVERPALENVLSRINKTYATAMVTVGYADFERIRDNTLEYCGLWDLFTYKPYKSAVGKYFGRKRAQDEKSGYIVGTVYEADDKSVLVAASKDVKIQFLAKNTRAKITFCDLNNGNERTSRMGGSTRVTREEFIRAKQVAFAVIKSHRKK